jgi:hypothetical protein
MFFFQNFSIKILSKNCTQEKFSKNSAIKLFKNFVTKICFGSFSQECFFKSFLSKYYPKRVHKRNFRKFSAIILLKKFVTKLCFEYFSRIFFQN